MRQYYRYNKINIIDECPCLILYNNHTSKVRSISVASHIINNNNIHTHNTIPIISLHLGKRERELQIASVYNYAQIYLYDHQIANILHYILWRIMLTSLPYNLLQAS